MNEADTRAELIDPALKESGWGVVEDSKILREHNITDGQIQVGGRRGNPIKADYVLVYRNYKLAVIEAKSDDLEVGEGVAQAKNYATKLELDTAFSSNGTSIYQICMKTGIEGLISCFPSPDELWEKTFSIQNHWRDTFNQVPFECSAKAIRFYQEIAVNKTMAAIAEEKQRILLTLATGTGKTFIAFQIAWRLYQSRWNLKRDGTRRPRILFLTDRNILADQAFNDFSGFPQDALVRIDPKDIAKRGSVPFNGSVFFTIFQTFMSGKDNQFHFGQYQPDYFDFIIIDECHRGGANDESAWRDILEYFSPAVQLGMTATPKRKNNIDTYDYFGEPIFAYSLKEGINDGFLTPFKVKAIDTTLDKYIYTADDQVIEGEVEEGKEFTKSDFNKIIEIKAREEKRVKIMLSEINQNEKTIVFCATQDHAMAIRDLINQYKNSSEPDYCVRVTANDGKLGDQYLESFRENDKPIPTILTTSKKLSTGVDARNIRNIVLMRPINTMIEFKQIVGRGTRLFDGKDFFTIYDFEDAYRHFSDPEWDGEPLDMTTTVKAADESHDTVQSDEQPKSNDNSFKIQEEDVDDRRPMLKIKLRDGKEREIQHMIKTMFWSADGKPISVEEFLHNLYGVLPRFFKNEQDLRERWSSPITRKVLLNQLAEAGFGWGELIQLQKLINAEKSDLFDVLKYIASSAAPMTREIRASHAQSAICLLDSRQKEFLEFVLSKYIDTGVEELDEENLPALLEIKYNTISDAIEALGNQDKIRDTFINFQRYLYEPNDKHVV